MGQAHLSHSRARNPARRVGPAGFRAHPGIEHIVTSFLDGLKHRRAQTYRAAEDLLTRAAADGRRSLTSTEATELRGYQESLRGLDEHIADLADDEQRAQLPDRYANLGGRGGRSGDRSGWWGGCSQKTGAMLSPLGFTDGELRHAFDTIHRGEVAILEHRDPGFAGPIDGLIPPDLGPIIPVFPRHEDRLLNYLPGVAIDVPAIQYIEVVSTTGTAGIVAEGAAKPELLMPADAKVATARKIAAHVGVSWEAMNDYDAFVASVQGELIRCIVDAENLQLYGGTGEANNQVNGLLSNANILTLASGSGSENYTDISAGIAALRNGPSLAVCNLILLHPETWAAIRVQKDGYGRFLSDPNPTVEQANTIFGIPIVVSTQFTAGEAVLFDTRLYGRAIIREALVTRMGFSGTDLVQNIVRYVSETRITQTIERPQAILKLTGLPTTAPTVLAGDTEPAETETTRTATKK
ncbi:phage major capsid protein [Mycobacterium sp. OTB74]|jgi:hypothetical protein|uniref:phage major capsid protein n=1 Tax=Mycobacterium sp. OTB74 TaxID=1853452 RepID=UPI002475F673|nr:phage major capsid protein [Mycobacterium sp. OTB74]MDH6245034.1 hypothetical protein [Mycobacterium sp. OTB74]